MQKVGHVHQTKKFLHNKGNHQQNEKGIYWMEENMCKSHIQKEVNIKE